MQVFGACIVDYSDPGERARLMDNMHQGLAKACGALPSSRLLVHPPFDTAMNTTGHGLGNAQKDRWKEHFFNKQYTGGKVQVAEFDAHPYNPLARTFCVVQMAWTYL